LFSGHSIESHFSADSGLVDAKSGPFVRDLSGEKAPLRSFYNLEILDTEWRTHQLNLKPSDPIAKATDSLKKDGVAAFIQVHLH
jgi:hypothetical protein